MSTVIPANKASASRSLVDDLLVRSVLDTSARGSFPAGRRMI